MKKSIKAIIFLGVLAGLAVAEPLPSFAQDINVTRIQGSTRYETAVEVSKYNFSTSDYAIVASGEKFPDALVGGTLATQIKAPVLLTQRRSISPKVIDEIERLDVEKIYLLGGTSVVDSTVERELQKVATVERVAGKDRYETNELINAVRLQHPSFDTSIERSPYAMGDSVMYASGTKFPDALAAAPLIGQISDSVLTYLLLAKPGQDVAPFPAIGGPSAVRSSDPDVIRYYGNNRYTTATMLGRQYLKLANKSIDTVIVVSGKDFPDALSAAPLAGMNNAAILLTDPKVTTQVTRGFILTNQIENVIIVGGDNAVSSRVARELVSEDLGREDKPGDYIGSVGWISIYLGDMDKGQPFIVNENGERLPMDLLHEDEYGDLIYDKLFPTRPF